MDNVGPSTWRLTLELENPLQFKVLINDSDWSKAVPNERIGPGHYGNYYPYFQATPGTVETIGHLPFYDHPVPIRVYRPPGFGQNPDKRYPVLYCLDGQNLFDPHGPDWQLDESLDRLIHQGIIEPLLVVGIDSRWRDVDYTPWPDPKYGGGGAENFLPFVLDVKTIVDHAFPTLRAAEHTGLMGSSLGGLFTLYASRRRPDVFTKVAALSPSFWWNSEHMFKVVAASQQHDPQKIYLDAGTGPTEKSTAEHVEMIKHELVLDGWIDGHDLMTRTFEGAEHNEWAWGSRLEWPLGFLYPKQRT